MPFSTRSYDLARQRAGSVVSFSRSSSCTEVNGWCAAIPAVVLLVPLEHREIHHPEELEILRVEQLVAVVELLRARTGATARTPGRRSLRDDGPSARRPTPPAAADRSRRRRQRSRTLAIGSGIVALQALGIVVDAQPALLCRTPSTRRAPCGSACRCRECGSPPAAARRSRSSGQQVLHRMHRRHAQVGLVAAVAAHGLARRSCAETAPARRSPATSQTRCTSGSITSKMRSCCGNDISRSICVNSGWRSARRSSSRKQRTIWKYFSKPLTISSCLKICGDCGSA